MVLGKDENIFCVADAQTAIKRLVAEPKITAYLAMKVIEVQHYLHCWWSTTYFANAVLLLSHMRYYSCFSSFFCWLYLKPALGWLLFCGAWRYWEYDGSKWTDLSASSTHPMTAKADCNIFVMDGFVRRKGRAGDRMKADGVERFRILTGKRKNIEKIIGKLTQKS